MKLRLGSIFVLGGPLQLLYSIKLMWIGLASWLGISYIITELNFMLNFPINLLLFIFGILGIIGVPLKLFTINAIFALFNILLYTICSITFMLHADFGSVSGGNYFLDTIGSLFLLITITKARKT